MMADVLRFAEALAIKVEPEVVVLDDDDDDASANADAKSGYDDGGDGGGFVLAPKSMEGLKEAGPPPFLSKTFAMVDDPNTDAIISWGATQKSFVVWDQHKFSTDLLPQHFKHSNFSSFIRQLNTYRFRKVDSDRWEFANEGFQKGKKHLLKNIKRRKQHHHPYMQQQGIAETRIGVHKIGTDGELQRLRIDHTALKMEVIRLKQQQQTTESHLARVKEQLELAETRQKHLLLFVAKVLRNPLLFQSLIERMKERAELRGCEPTKKMRFGNENVDAVAQALVDDEEQIKNISGVCDTPEINCGNFIGWDNLMEEDEDEMNYENLVTADEHQYSIVHQLEDVLAGDLVVDQADCPLPAEVNASLMN